MGENEKSNKYKKSGDSGFMEFRDRSEIDKEEKNMGKYKGLFWPAILGVKAYAEGKGIGVLQCRGRVPQGYDQ